MVRHVLGDIAGLEFELPLITLVVAIIGSSTLLLLDLSRETHILRVLTERDLLLSLSWYI